MRIIFIPPGYQRQFKPWLEVLDPSLIVSSKTNQDYSNIRVLRATELFGFLRRKSRREALWFPVSIGLIIEVMKRRIDECFFIGEPSYLMNIWLLILSTMGCKVYIRFAQNISNSLPFPFSLMERKVVERATGILCVAPPSKRVLLEKLGYHLESKISIISNPILDEFYYSQALDEIEYRFQQKSILFVGLFEKHKGFDDFLKMQVHPGVKKIAIGEGDLRSSTMHADIEFSNWLSRSELIKVYRKSSLLIVPSKTVDNNISSFGFVQVGWSEQFGRVVAEAQACGVPVLAYDSGALSWVVGNGGKVFKEGDMHSIAREIEVLLSDFVRYKEKSMLAIKNAERFNTKSFKKRLQECVG